MRGAIPPLPLTSSWYRAYLITGATFLLLAVYCELSEESEIKFVEHVNVYKVFSDLRAQVVVVVVNRLSDRG
jgi:hypothetical protein